MYYVELRALLQQSIRLGTYFFLAVESNGGSCIGRDEYHLNVMMEPGERIAALGRTCTVQFDAEYVGRTDHGVLPPVGTPLPPRVLRLRTNHVQNQYHLTRMLYLWINDTQRGKAVRLDSPQVEIQTLEPGHYLLKI